MGRELTLAQLLYASGFLFMGATEEQMDLVVDSALDHVSYILILYSLAFLLFLFVNMLIHIYDQSANPITHQKDLAIRVNGQTVETRQVRDAEEFELEGLMSDDEDDVRMLRTDGTTDSDDVQSKDKHMGR
jgi:hypothetical protein